MPLLASSTRSAEEFKQMLEYAAKLAGAIAELDHALSSHGSFPRAWRSSIHPCTR